MRKVLTPFLALALSAMPLATLAAQPPAPPGKTKRVCSGVISATTVKGGLVVPAGATCQLDAVVVNGHVKVQPGGTLTVCGSSLNGGIAATDAAAITVGSGADADDTSQCAPSSINGDVTILDSGTTAVELEGATISETVTLTNNGAVQVEGNTIGGDLDCTGNASVTNDGLPNTVTGTESGQCLGL